MPKKYNGSVNVRGFM